MFNIEKRLEEEGCVELQALDFQKIEGLIRLGFRTFGSSSPDLVSGRLHSSRRLVMLKIPSWACFLVLFLHRAGEFKPGVVALDPEGGFAVGVAGAGTRNRPE
jgi:hypothetical protein